MKKYIYEIFVIILFAVLSFILTLNHELWYDEAQAWMIGHNMNVIEIFNYMKTEGHSCLWSLFLKLFNFIPFNCSNFISWFIGNISVILIMLYIKCNKYIKTLFVINPITMIACTVLLRCYSLSLLLIVLLILFYNNRYKYPFIYGLILMLLVNTHILIWGLVGGLILVEIYELIKDKDNIKSRLIIILISIIGLLFFFIQIVGSTSSRSDIFSNSNNLLLMTINVMNGLINNKLLSVISIILIIIFIYNNRDNKKMLFINIISILWLLFVFSIYNEYGIKSLYIYLILIFVYCIYNNKTINSIIISLIFVITIPYLIHEYSYDLYGSYSYEKNINDYLVSNNISNNKIGTSFYYVSLVGYDNYSNQFYNIYDDMEYTYGYHNLDNNHEGIFSRLIECDYYLRRIEDDDYTLYDSNKFVLVYSDSFNRLYKIVK